MLPLLESIENSGYAIWVRESSSVFAYPTILALHTLGLGLVVGISTAIALRLLGVAPALPLAPLKRFFPVVWIGLAINALSGLALIPTAAINFFSNPVFYVKLLGIAAALSSFRLLQRSVFADPAALATGAVSARARGLAASMLAFWGVAIVAGRLTAYSGFVVVATVIAVLIVALISTAAAVAVHLFVPSRVVRPTRA